MMHWVITVPKTVDWAEYEKELDAVKDGSQIMNYRVRYFPKGLEKGDRCFIVYDGLVRGWMEIVGTSDNDEPFVCSTTGVFWPAGKYIQRSGPFYKTDGPKMQGFRGIRKFEYNA